MRAPGQIRTDHAKNLENPWSNNGFLQTARTHQDTSGHIMSKTLKTLGKTWISASWVHGGLGGRPFASRGRWWILLGGMQKPLVKQYIPVCAPAFSGAPVPSGSEQVRAGQITAKTLEIISKNNDSAIYPRLLIWGAMQGPVPTIEK